MEDTSWVCSGGCIGVGRVYDLLEGWDIRGVWGLVKVSMHSFPVDLEKGFDFLFFHSEV